MPGNGTGTGQKMEKEKMEPTRSCFLEEETPGSVYEYGLCYSR